MMNARKLALKQLDHELMALKKSNCSVPRFGWIRTIRKALGMSAKQLASRLNVSRTRIVELEHAERTKATTLKSLKEAANALDCDLVYAFLPRTSLSQTLKQQALKKAKLHLKTIAHSMALEDQATTKKELQEELNELAESFLTGSMRHLWEE